MGEVFESGVRNKSLKQGSFVCDAYPLNSTVNIEVSKGFDPKHLQALIYWLF